MPMKLSRRNLMKGLAAFAAMPLGSFAAMPLGFLQARAEPSTPSVPIKYINLEDKNGWGLARSRRNNRVCMVAHRWPESTKYDANVYDVFVEGDEILLPTYEISTNIPLTTPAEDDARQCIDKLHKITMKEVDLLCKEFVNQFGYQPSSIEVFNRPIQTYCHYIHRRPVRIVSRHIGLIAYGKQR